MLPWEAGSIPPIGALQAAPSSAKRRLDALPGRHGGDAVSSSQLEIGQLGAGTRRAARLRDRHGHAVQEIGLVWFGNCAHPSSPGRIFAEAYVTRSSPRTACSLDQTGMPMKKVSVPIAKPAVSGPIQLRRTRSRNFIVQTP